MDHRARDRHGPHRGGSDDRLRARPQRGGEPGGPAFRRGQPAPVFVIFLTDGGNADKPASADVLRELSAQPVFMQSVGIGKEDFPFLHKLDELPGRVIDNAGFMHVNDLDAIKDAELYDRLLNEFPSWLTTVREQGMI
ncbi:MAG: VWA domain-containing protein [Candidatus Competibacteraceae bacterium]|nr:VWA domain-containing protein [Candidatus Competibacteraceae bacterium]MCB1821460.1 VWA domain-containing protein [Candidatus Competibacteraceae bacterium]